MRRRGRLRVVPRALPQVRQPPGGDALPVLAREVPGRGFVHAHAGAQPVGGSNAERTVPAGKGTEQPRARCRGVGLRPAELVDSRRTVPVEHDRPHGRRSADLERPRGRTGRARVLRRASVASSRQDPRATPRTPSGQRCVPRTRTHRPRYRAGVRRRPADPWVFAVEPDCVQLTWRRGRDGRPGTKLVGGLEPATTQTVRVDEVGTEVAVTTIGSPPGAETCRIATINDLHIGCDYFGLLGHMTEPPASIPHAVRCTRNAIDEALAWGA